MAGEELLFIEDDDSGRELGLFNLRKAGYAVDGARDGAEGLRRFDPERHAVVITDVRMPNVGGLEVLREIRARSPETPVLVITAYGDVDLAVAAMKAGAFDFIGKPFHREHLLLTVAKALERGRMRAELLSLQRQVAGVERAIVGRSPAMARVLDLADRVARAAAPVLVTGESGTGKELIARRIHARSSRGAAPFVAVNCAAIPAELLESELFGHVRGAFSGALRDRPGRFRQADGGTLFLDEVAELPPPLQAKLLRALQERVIDVVGSDVPVPVDVRVIAATNRDPGDLRGDLLYRLRVVEIELPPLRDRVDDIPQLVRHFVARFAAGRDVEIPEDVLADMSSRPWPGNVRELENACERAVILCAGDVLRTQDLPPRTTAAPAVAGGGDEWLPALPEDGLSLVDLEKRVIERVLALKRGNITQAAAYLRVPRHVLSYRMEKYGLRRGG
ncbi:sigma-54-dependent transcriptional regulator [Nannocystis bainbridge]|uniref:Sigma-54 dependent transcriptional regulator n=1 Tax=Nannocystis bainbridge TaxID=2995303 RepID=A0ABT5EBT9_9BACT|nr:sigma-54 dependent transcriptional regulator [Nannocystis bainbridge]MDC0723321.1 sigma-54 dependent transcriptional regulator [Nannocystis bainbridge]